MVVCKCVFAFLVVFAALGGVYGEVEVKELNPIDESYCQGASETKAMPRMASTARALPEHLLPKHKEWKQNARKTISFYVFLDEHRLHSGDPKPADESTSPNDLKHSFIFQLEDGKIPDFYRAALRKLDTNKFVFLTHGWTASYKEEKYFIHKRDWMTMTAHDLRVFRHRHVIIVDYTEIAAWDYLKATTDGITVVAETIKDLIEDLKELTGFETGSDLIMAGHSMGAHLFGRVGQLLKKEVALIVGIDPAGPLFIPEDETRHCLTYRDAKRVFLLHTSDEMGSIYMLGTRDFFVNCGIIQPELRKSLKSLSHKRGTNVFRATIYRRFEAVGYVCLTPKVQCDPSTAFTYYFDIDEIKTARINQPIFMPTIGIQPFFMKDFEINHVPGYKVTEVKKKTAKWEKIIYSMSKCMEAVTTNEYNQVKKYEFSFRCVSDRIQIE